MLNPRIFPNEIPTWSGPGWREEGGRQSQTARATRTDPQDTPSFTGGPLMGMTVRYYMILYLVVGLERGFYFP